MNKLKVLLTILMGTLIAFSAQRAYYVKTGELSSIYSDIIFTRLAVESQEYTRQIEYGVKNGKSLENFYNISSVLSGVRRCCSYTNGVYIFSSDRRQLYSLNDGGSPVTRFSVGDFSGGSVYSVYDDSAGGRYVLTLPIFGRGNEVCGYMVLDISRDAVENTLSDISEEYRKQSAALGILCWLTGALMMIHLCKSKEKLFRQGTLVISAAVCMQSALDAAISVFKFSVTIGSIIQQSVSKITMSLQNDLDTVNEKGVALSKIYDLNSWLMENYKDIPFIDNLIYDRNYRITAVISDSYINERTWSYAAALLMMVLLCAGAGLLLTAAVTWIERSVYLFRRNKQNGNNSGAGKTEYAEEGDNLIVIPEEEGEINVAWFMYEFIALSIPMKHVHAPGKCNKAVTSKLNKHLKTNANEDSDDTFDTGGDDIVIEEEVEQQIDPRWIELKKILDNI